MSRLHDTRRQNATMRRDLANALVTLREMAPFCGIYFSSRETALADRLIARAESWLNPPAPEPLLAQMSKLIQDINAARAMRQQQTEAHAIEIEHVEAEAKRIRDNAHAKQRDAMEARRLMQLKTGPVNGS
jgi:hypothetical protein